MSSVLRRTAFWGRTCITLVVQVMLAAACSNGQTPLASPTAPIPLTSTPTAVVTDHTTALVSPLLTASATPTRVPSMMPADDVVRTLLPTDLAPVSPLGTPGPTSSPMTATPVRRSG